MSHWAKIETQFVHERELTEALEEMFGKNCVEKHANGIEISTYGQKTTVNLLVKRDFTKSFDLGFICEDGVYKMIRESMHRLDQQQLVQSYAERVIKNRLPRGRYRVLDRSRGRIKLQQIK